MSEDKQAAELRRSIAGQTSEPYRKQLLSQSSQKVLKVDKKSRRSKTSFFVIILWWTGVPPVSVRRVFVQLTADRPPCFCRSAAPPPPSPTPSPLFV
ncbi:unnamed protein product [Caenorhabditis auriculariae]|uniref:Uncharacterized protein n=1 Tax=Caenorhabditis auriculariae TaxID=2777116 RepID=A0A8S1HL56_9PELO|nr:unnamed protein product [Caenorhabditis auriculariae]